MMNKHPIARRTFSDKYKVVKKKFKNMNINPHNPEYRPGYNN